MMAFGQLRPQGATRGAERRAHEKQGRRRAAPRCRRSQATNYCNAHYCDDALLRRTFNYASDNVKNHAIQGSAPRRVGTAAGDAGGATHASDDLTRTPGHAATHTPSRITRPTTTPPALYARTRRRSSTNGTRLRRTTVRPRLRGMPSSHFSFFIFFCFCQNCGGGFPVVPLWDSPGLARSTSSATPLLGADRDRRY